MESGGGGGKVLERTGGKKTGDGERDGKRGRGEPGGWTHTEGEMVSTAQNTSTMKRDPSAKE